MSNAGPAQHASKQYVLPPSRAPHDYSTYLRLVNSIKRLNSNLEGAESYHIPASQLGFDAEEVPDVCASVADALHRLQSRAPNKRAWWSLYRPNVWASTLKEGKREIVSYQDSVMWELDSLESMLKRDPSRETLRGSLEVNIVIGRLTDLLDQEQQAPSLITELPRTFTAGLSNDRIAGDFLLLRHAIVDIEIYAGRRGVTPDTALQPLKALTKALGPGGAGNWRKLNQAYGGGDETYQRVLLEAAYRTRAMLVLVATVNLPRGSVSVFVEEECRKILEIWTQGLTLHTEHTLAHRSGFPAYSRKNQIYGCTV